MTAGSQLIGFRLVGFRGLVRSLNGAPRMLEDAIAKKMGVLVIELAGEAQRHITGSRATNPPEVLGVLSSRLKQSITGRVEVERPFIRGLVGPQRLKYARIHEFGGEAGRRAHPVHIPKRPYLGPALKAKRERIVQELGASFDGVVRSIATTGD